jgi:hypothetical protein
LAAWWRIARHAFLDDALQFGALARARGVEFLQDRLQQFLSGIVQGFGVGRVFLEHAGPAQDFSDAHRLGIGALAAYLS